MKLWNFGFEDYLHVACTKLEEKQYKNDLNLHEFFTNQTFPHFYPTYSNSVSAKNSSRQPHRPT